MDSTLHLGEPTECLECAGASALGQVRLPDEVANVGIAAVVVVVGRLDSEVESADPLTFDACCVDLDAVDAERPRYAAQRLELGAGVEERRQQHVSGEVRLMLHGGRAVVTGRRSESSLYDFGMATYDTGDTFDQGLAKGFVQLWGMPSKLAAARGQRLGGTA